MGKEKEFLDDSILEMFGLTYEQAKLMFSAQVMLAKYDCKQTKDKKSADYKEKWIREWEHRISDYLQKINNSCTETLYLEVGLAERFINEIAASNNRTWYYIVVLELLEFNAFIPLGGENDKKYAKCKYDKKKAKAFLKEFICKQRYLSVEKIERIDKTYDKSLSKIYGKTGKIVAGCITVIAISGIAAAVAAVAAGSIAVVLVGGMFEGLRGAALVAACLAYIGGGAIAAGGAGMAGGVAVIAGGGALLGLAGGGTIVGIGTHLLSSSPEFVLTQAAKLETILQEVILNAQQDVETAQKVIARYQQKIDELNSELTRMELENEKNKKELKNIKTSIEYLKRSCKDMKQFTSSYEIGKTMEG